MVQWAGGLLRWVLLVGIVGTTIGRVRANVPAVQEQRANLAAQQQK